MAAVEGNLDRLYRQLKKILENQMPTEDQLRELIEEATILKCGFIVERGKPGTLKLSPFVPMNTIMRIDLDAINDIGAIKLPGWEKFQ